MAAGFLDIPPTGDEGNRDQTLAREEVMPVSQAQVTTVKPDLYRPIRSGIGGPV
jgi:hypothetical protein